MFLDVADAKERRAGEGLRAYFGGLEKPAARRKKRFRGSAVGDDLEPALDSPRIGDAPALDGVGGERGRLEPGRHFGGEASCHERQAAAGAFLAPCLSRRSTVGDACAPTERQYVR